MNKTFEQQYLAALLKVLKHGEKRINRTQTAAISCFDISFEVDPSVAYPILTGKFIDIGIVNAEFEWFISGQTNTKIFKDRGIKIWDLWADEQGELGPVYGHQLRDFNSQGYDQLSRVIEGINLDPYGRRHVISLWNPNQLQLMALPPCYLYFQFYVSKGSLNMFVVQRSGDMFAGVPYDICLFTNLLGFVASATRLNIGMIKHNIVDAHIYVNHLTGLNQYRESPFHTPPTWTQDLFGQTTLKDYISNPRIKIPIAK